VCLVVASSSVSAKQAGGMHEWLASLLLATMSPPAWMVVSLNTLALHQASKSLTSRSSQTG
jgi:hypothetical protein